MFLNNALSCIQDKEMLEIEKQNAVCLGKLLLEKTAIGCGLIHHHMERTNWECMSVLNYSAFQPWDIAVSNVQSV